MAYQPKSYRKFLATGVATAMVATTVAPAVSADQHTDFTDIEDVRSWAGDAIDYLVEKGAIQGMGTPGIFNPQGELTRGQAASLLANTLGLDVDEDATSGFDDLAGHWSDAYVAAIQAELPGVIDGYTDGTFRPENDITRQEMAKITVEAFDLEVNADADVDFEDNNSWGAEYVEVLASLGILGGYTDGTIRPEADITRAEAAVFVHRTEVPSVRLGQDEVAELAVESVSAITEKGLTTVTAEIAQAYEDAEATFEIFAGGDTDEDPVLTETIEIEDGEAVAEFENLPVGEHLVRVTVEAEDEDGEDAVGEATFEIEQLELALDEADATTEAIRKAEDQQLEFTVDGEDYTVGYLESQGYDVEFSYNRTGAAYGADGVVDASDLAHEGTFRYQVEVSKDDESVESDLQTVTVYDEEIAVEITETALQFDADGDILLDYVTTTDVQNFSIIATMGVNYFGEELDYMDEDEDYTAPSISSISSNNTTVATIVGGKINPRAEGTASFDVDFENAETYELTFDVREDQKATGIASYDPSRIQADNAGQELEVVFLDQFGETLRTNTVLNRVDVEVTDEDGDEVTNPASSSSNDIAKGEITYVLNALSEGTYTFEYTEDGDLVGSFDLTAVDVTEADIDSFGLVEVNDSELDVTVGDENLTKVYNIVGEIDGVRVTGTRVGEALRDILQDENLDLELASSDEDVLEVDFEDTNSTAFVPFDVNNPQIEVTAQDGGSATVTLSEIEGNFSTTLASIDIDVNNETPQFDSGNLMLLEDTNRIAMNDIDNSDDINAAEIVAGLESSIEGVGEDVPASAIDESSIEVANVSLQSNGALRANVTFDMEEVYGGETFTFPIEIEDDYGLFFNNQGTTAFVGQKSSEGIEALVAHDDFEDVSTISLGEDLALGTAIDLNENTLNTFSLNNNDLTGEDLTISADGVRLQNGSVANDVISTGDNFESRNVTSTGDVTVDGQDALFHTVEFEGSTVTVNQDATFNRVTWDAASTITVADTRTLTLAGNITNGSEIEGDGDAELADGAVLARTVTAFSFDALDRDSGTAQDLDVTFTARGDFNAGETIEVDFSGLGLDLDTIAAVDVEDSDGNTVNATAETDGNDDKLIINVTDASGLENGQEYSVTIGVAVTQTPDVASIEFDVDALGVNSVFTNTVTLTTP